MSPDTPNDAVPAAEVPYVLAFHRLPAEEQLAYRRALSDSYAAGEGEMVSIDLDGTETVLGLLAGESAEDRSGSYARLEHWVPGSFGTAPLALCLRGTDLPRVVEFEIDGHLLRAAQAQIHSAGTSGLGFPSG